MLQRNYRRRCIVRGRHNHCQRCKLSVMCADATKYFFGYRRRDRVIVHQGPRARHDQIGNRVLDHRHPLREELMTSRSCYLVRIGRDANFVKNADCGIHRNFAGLIDKP